MVGRDQVKRRGSRCWGVEQVMVWRAGLGGRVWERDRARVTWWKVMRRVIIRATSMPLGEAARYIR